MLADWESPRNAFLGRFRCGCILGLLSPDSARCFTKSPMISLESVDYDTFAPFTGYAFITQAGGGQVEMQLEAVQKLGHRRDDAVRDPFSLTFRGPPGLLMPQGIHAFSCEALGEIELFITQVANGARGSEFEAIFT